MRIIIRFIIIANALVLSGLAILLSVNHVFESSARLNEALDKAGVYQALSKSVQDNFQKNLTQAGVADPLVMTSVSKVITPAQIQKLLQPTIISIASWLKSPASATELPQTTIDLTTVKSALDTQFAKDLDAAKAAALSFEVTKAIPDSLDLTPTAQLEDGGGTQATTKPNEANNKALTDIKANYDRAKAWQLPMLISALALSALLLVLNIKRGRAKLTKLAWSFLGAGLIVAGLSYGAPVVVGGVGNGQDTAKVVAGLMPVLLEDARIYGLIYLVISVVLGIVALVFMRPASSKRK